MSTTPKPSQVEMQILSILWEKGPLPVKDINALMPDKKKRAYTTVLTVLQLMEKKGLVTKLVLFLALMIYLALHLSKNY